MYIDTCALQVDYIDYIDYNKMVFPLSRKTLLLQRDHGKHKRKSFDQKVKCCKWNTNALNSKKKGLSVFKQQDHIQTCHQS